jgi:hypothetical protein
MLLVISDKPDVERDAVADAWQRAGGEVLRLARFWEPPALDRSRVRLYGAETFCQVVAQKLDLELVSPSDDWLVHLPRAFTKRTIMRTTLAGADTFPAFVKSMIPKLIPSRVYESSDELRAASTGAEPETTLILSEIVELVAEVRTWILDGEVLAAAAYEGDANLEDARRFAATVPCISPCVVDAGLTAAGEWLVIEANAAWGAGLNGCDPDAAARCIARATRPR